MTGITRPEDAAWMRLALDWSYRGKGWTSPRPSVGCVLVRETPQGGVLLGAGHTQPGHGNPHAEIMALAAAAAAGHDTRGATAYVTLEPCSHYATTPPCTNALIAAGVARVVSGVVDTNPAVNGNGYRQLRAAGIEVVSGFMAEECAIAQDDFLKHISTGLPFVTLKTAVSLDGKVALENGQSQWITGSQARRRAHRLRHEHDAVLVGIGTLLADDPRLDVRLEGKWKQPARIVVDSTGRTPTRARIFNPEGAGRVFVATTRRISPERREQLETAGAQVVITSEIDGRVDLSELCRALYERGICSILIEGGPVVAGAALNSGIVDKCTVFIAPLLLGAGREALAGVRHDDLQHASRLHHVRHEILDDDVLVSGYVKPFDLGI